MVRFVDDILYDNTLPIPYSAYLEYCQYADEAPKFQPDSTEFYEWAGEQEAQDWDDLIMNIKYSKQNGRCVVSGHLGLWDGQHEIQPRHFEDLTAAIQTCAQSADFIKVFVKRGVLNVEAIHHDGCNCFEIRLLSAHGLRLGYEFTEIKPDYVKFITHYLF